MHSRRAMIGVPNGIALGDLIGDYRIVGEMTGGGHRAVHVASGRKVVLEIAAEAWQTATVRMMRGAQAIAALQHPGIARIVDRGVARVGIEKLAWQATEVPAGVGLYDVIARRAMTVAEAVGLVRDLADVLAHAHARDVLHRALALRAIVLPTGARGFPVCISDWASERDIGIYTAPEIERGERGDGRVDVFALGVIAYRVATGRFPDGAVADVGGVPDGFATLIARMLARSPAARPTAAEVRAVAAGLTYRDEPGVAPIAGADAVVVGDDVVAASASSPRFTRPRWTPPPPSGVPITSDAATTVAGEISDDDARR